MKASLPDAPSPLLSRILGLTAEDLPETHHRLGEGGGGGMRKKGVEEEVWRRRFQRRG
jgi:hypothetical protein